MAGVVLLTEEQLDARLEAAAERGAAKALAARETCTTASSPLISKQALASSLGVSTATVDRLDRAGTIGHVQVGDVRRYDLATVRAALASAPPKVAAPKKSTGGVLLLSKKTA